MKNSCSSMLKKKFIKIIHFFSKILRKFISIVNRICKANPVKARQDLYKTQLVSLQMIRTCCQCWTGPTDLMGGTDVCCRYLGSFSAFEWRYLDSLEWLKRGRSHLPGRLVPCAKGSMWTVSRPYSQSWRSPTTRTNAQTL